MEEERVLEDVAARLQRETSIEAGEHPIELAVADGELTLTGEVDGIRAKRIAVRAAGEVPGVRRVVDHLVVRSSTPMTDGEIRDRVRAALLTEPALVEVGLRERARSEVRVIREPLKPNADLAIEVEDGTVTLRGVAPSLTHRRLAAALAWRIPGTRNVIDEVTVDPPEADHDGEIADALLMLLETDPGVDPASLDVHVEDAVVRLRGWVTRRAARDSAEHDAWLVEGVQDVVNEIGVSVRE